MRELLLDLEARIRESIPDLAARVDPPATDEDIQGLQTHVGATPLPQDLIDLYGWRNGGNGELWFGGGGFWFFRSIDSIIKLTTEWRRQPLDLSSGTTDETTNPPADGIWPRPWIPFADYNSDVFAVADCRESARTPVLGVDIEGGQVVRWADSLDDFFRYVLSLRRQGQELDIDELMAGETPLQVR